MSRLFAKPLQNRYTWLFEGVFDLLERLVFLTPELLQVIGSILFVGESVLVATGGIEPPTLGL
jgi:hypothetical protein